MTLLSPQGLSKSFGAVAAVDRVSLDIAQGEFFAFLGASGSGKTTLLRMLAGFEEPTAGRILLDDQDVTAVPPNRRPVNLMFQSYALFPHMTVRANVAYGLEMERLAAGLTQARLAELAGFDRQAVQYWEAKPALDRDGWAPRRILQALGLPGSRTSTRARGWGLTRVAGSLLAGGAGKGRRAQGGQGEDCPGSQARPLWCEDPQGRPLPEQERAGAPALQVPRGQEHGAQDARGPGQDLRGGGGSSGGQRDKKGPPVPSGGSVRVAGITLFGG